MSKKRVLILCTANSCRSQMAEGVLRHYGAGQYDVFSAGTRPTIVNPLAMRVMKEIGIDISTHRSKRLDEFLGQEFDYVITVCDNANEACPVFPGKTTRLHWSFPDPPSGINITPEMMAEFRRVRDLIHDRFKAAADTGFSP